MAGTVLAVDVGGTKFAAALVEADGSIRSRAAVPTPSTRDAGVVAEALRGLLDQVASMRGSSRLSSVGIGSAGPVDPVAGTVSPVNIPAWRDFDLVGAVGRSVPDRPIVLAGDGHCMALGEYWRGGHASRSMLGIVVSTGVGGGLVIDGRVFAGPTGNAGHIGHMSVDVAGEPCPCGGRGCVEMSASGPAMVRWALANGWRNGTVPSGVDGDRGVPLSARHPPDARQLAHDARAGHPVAREAFVRAAQALATAIVSAAALIDLDDVVIGGGVAAAGDLLFAPLRTAIDARAGLAFVRRTRVHPSPLGADAGLLGAAALALDAAPS
jgi:glucokinase